METISVESITTCNGLQDSCKQTLQGNNAKMREALIKARSEICKFAEHQCQSLSWENSNIQSNCGDVLCSRRGLCNAKTAINAALAAPPRNCDRYPTFASAIDAWRDIDPRVAGSFDAWLFDEAKGEAK